MTTTLAPTVPTITHYTLVDGENADGTRWTTVLAWDGDHCLGGDRHWLARMTAETIMHFYERGEVEHGKVHSFPGGH